MAFKDPGGGRGVRGHQCVCVYQMGHFTRVYYIREFPTTTRHTLLSLDIRNARLPGVVEGSTRARAVSLASQTSDGTMDCGPVTLRNEPAAGGDEHSQFLRVNVVKAADRP